MYPPEQSADIENPPPGASHPRGIILTCRVHISTHVMCMLGLSGGQRGRFSLGWQIRLLTLFFKNKMKYGGVDHFPTSRLGLNK